MSKQYLILAACALLVACKEERTQDVSYYLSHPEQRQAKLAECEINPGDKAVTANCINAKEAQHKSLFDSKNTGMPSIK
ncbi:EexN family lipoprotein [Pseudomonas sp. D47]|uniref:EexN family lipoprotein n=1 Tax=Pseudomonas sp. D47 TaxID=3159447 RepID=UPI00387B3EB2